MNKNDKKWYEKWIDPNSKEALEKADKFCCEDCLPVDRNRIKFVTVKDHLRDEQIFVIWEGDKGRKYGDDYKGVNRIYMLCPLDCAIRGRAYDNDERYNKIKEETKHVKLRRAIRKHLAKKDNKCQKTNMTDVKNVEGLETVVQFVMRFVKNVWNKALRNNVDRTKTK